MSGGRVAPGPVLGRLAAGVLVGVSAWLSQGVVALVDPTRMMRVGALPDLTWLAAAAVAGAVVIVLIAPPAAVLTPLLVLALVWLPWLPLPVPGAFLMWDGPLEGFVWVCAFTGALWLNRARLGRRGTPAIPPARAPMLAAALSALILLGAWANVRERVPSGDEPHYLVITQSLLYDRDLRIENNHADRHYLAYFDGVLKPDFMQRGRDRQIYSIHAPGTSVVVAPAFFAAGYPGAVLTVIGLMALGMAFVWRAAYLVSGSTAGAWVGWLAVATAVPVVLHGFTIYPDPIGSVVAMAAVLALVTLEVTPQAAWGVGRWAALGAALATLPWLHTRFAVLAGVLGALLAWRLLRRPGGWRATAALLLAPALAAAGWFAYFWIIYGTLSPAAPYGRRFESGLAWVPQGIAGLLMDQQFGLAVNTPVLLFALAACAPLARRRPRLAAELAALMLPYLVAVGTFPMWWGGTSAPGRFIVVVLPMLALPLACAWATARGPRRVVIGVLLGVSMAWTALLVGVDHGAFMYNSRDGYSLLVDWLSRTVDLTLALPSVLRDGPLTALADTAVWTATGVLAAGLVTVVAQLGRPNAARAAAWLAVPATVMLATTVTWAARDRDVLSPSASQMWFLERWYPARAPLTVQLWPARRLANAEVPRRLSLGTSIRGPLPAADAPLLRIPLLPAGEYDVFVEAAGDLTGTVEVRLGRHEVPMETWALDGRPGGYTGLVLRLPLDAHSITMTGDPAARAAVRRLTLTPRLLALRAGGPAALRAGRFGHSVVYALDDNAYMEPGALWVRGTAAAQVMVQADAGTRPVVRVQAGAVDTVVTLSAGTWRVDVPLTANQGVDVPLPDAALAPATLSIASSAGFRPAEHSPATPDVRWLGVYVTWPEAPAAPAPSAPR